MGFFEKSFASLEKAAEKFELFKTLDSENKIPSPSPISAKKESSPVSFTFNLKAKEQEEIYEQRERFSIQMRIQFKNELRNFRECLETCGLVYKRSTNFF